MTASLDSSCSETSYAQFHRFGNLLSSTPYRSFCTSIIWTDFLITIVQITSKVHFLSVASGLYIIICLVHTYLSYSPPSQELQKTDTLGNCTASNGYFILLDAFILLKYWLLLMVVQNIFLWARSAACNFICRRTLFVLFSYRLVVGIFLFHSMLILASKDCTTKQSVNPECSV